MRIKPLVVVVILGIGQLSGNAGGTSAADEQDGSYSAELALMQARLSAGGMRHVALDQAELRFTADGWDGASPHIVFANDRTHRLSSQFVEDDPRRGSPPDTITYLVDQSDGSALTRTPAGIAVLPNAVTEAQLDASMAAWDDFKCNGPNVVKVADTGADPDVVDNLVLGGPLNPEAPYADITHAGWLPPAFFNAVFPGVGGILAATFTFIFVEDDGVTPTDIDRNGRADVAFREIYYNRGFGWTTGGGDPRDVDIQSIAIHEAGHGFGLAHFGKVTLKADGRFQFSPKAIMNAVYVAEDREITGSDNASFCSIWANKH